MWSSASTRWVEAPGPGRCRVGAAIVPRDTRVNGVRDSKLLSRARARGAVRPVDRVVCRVVGRIGQPGGVRSPGDVGGAEACRPPGDRRARHRPRRRRHRRQVGLRVARGAARGVGGEGRPAMSQRGDGEHPRQGGARPRDARPCRGLSELVVRHEQGLPLPGPQGGAARVRPVVDPPPHVGSSWTTTSRGPPSAAPRPPASPPSSDAPTPPAHARRNPFASDFCGPVPQKSDTNGRLGWVVGCGGDLCTGSDR